MPVDPDDRALAEKPVNRVSSFFKNFITVKNIVKSLIIAATIVFAGTPLLAANKTQPTVSADTEEGTSTVASSFSRFDQESECTITVEVEFGGVTGSVSGTGATCAEAADIVAQGIRDLKEVIKKALTLPGH